MRVVVMGTPEYGVPSLEALARSGYDVVGVFTQPDKPKGRGQRMTACPMKACAEALGIPVYQPVKIRADGVEPLRALAPDVCVTAAFGQILSQEVLDIPRIGTVNVHASLLPKYRGSAPINWCIINGETRTGVTTMMTDKGIDTGDILLQSALDILPDETAGELTTRLSALGADVLLETLRLLEQGACPRAPQEHAQMSYYPMLKKDMGLLDLSRDAQTLCRLVRGLSPWPCAYIQGKTETYKIWKASAEPSESDAPAGTVLEADDKRGLLVQTGQGALRIIDLQVSGKPRMNARDYLRGHAVSVGDTL